MTLMLIIRIFILIGSGCMHGSSHLSCTLTSAPFDTRYSAMDKYPPPAA
jgi:hypothetical protein